MACEADTDFDEDVILPNSPLGCYVQGLQHSEVNNLFDECFSSQDSIQECSDKMKFLPDDENKPFLSFKEYLLDVYRACFRFSSSFLALPVYLMIELSDMKHCFSVIKKYKLLIYEDEVFLKSWSSEFLNYDVKGLSKYKRKCVQWMLLFISILTSIAMYYILIDFSLFSVLIQGLCVLLFLFVILSILFCSVLSIEFALCFHVDSLSHHTSNILVLIKKSIRLIQEAELIARGFTAASVTGAAEHIELSSRLPINSCCRQYSELRKRLFSWMKNIFMKYKIKTSLVLQKISLDPVVDFPVCLASLNIEEFGGLLNFDIDSPELVKVTDNFSISSLKTMFHLMEMQISEFFKYLIVISSLATDNRPKEWKQVSYARCLKSNVITLSKDMSFFSESIKYAYYYYQSLEAVYVDDHDTRHSEPKMDKSSLKIAVHNMTLHLKAALLQLIQIENDLDLAIILEKKTENVESLRSALKIIKSEVSAFEDNFNESHKILNDLLNPDQSVATDVILPAIKGQKSQDLNPVIEKCDIEREITDEVFEDIITNLSRENNPQEGEFFPEEEVKKNVEMSSHLLKELKNVLVVKADEHRVREQLALAKKSNEINQIDLNENESRPSEETVRVDNHIEDNVGLDLLTLKKNYVITSEDEVEPYKYGKDVVSSDPVVSGMKQVHPSNDEDESKQCVKEAAFSIQKELSNSLCFIPSRTDSFAASIASAAAQRQKMFGLTSEEFIDGTDESDSDDS
ncbi:Vezatin [Araneus ventricosus]|uniref:Vezatin n=1 Tax=Araneus ventricosus TaxID=182803 RepID=A0A4Y2MT78_ARAVE|nr:Vezatin [Araneus ventricosus]GBN28859.1 Vezatin [Araneus ventricosus]